MISAKYRPKHDAGCQCTVCWTATFCTDMHQRNEERHRRSKQVFEKPHTRSDKFWSLERRVKGTPFVLMER